MVTNITIHARVALNAFVRVSIIVSIFPCMVTIDRIAISIRSNVFIFIHLFLQRTLTGMTTLRRRQYVARPTRIFISCYEPNPFILNSVHIILHLPQTLQNFLIIRITSTINISVVVFCIRFVQLITQRTIIFCTLQYSLSCISRQFPTLLVITIFRFEDTSIIGQRATIPKRSSCEPASHRFQSQTSPFVYTAEVLTTIPTINTAISRIGIRTNLFHHRMERFFLKGHIISRIYHMIDINSFTV